MTGLIVLMIGLLLIKVGIQYAGWWRWKLPHGQRHMGRRSQLDHGLYGDHRHLGREVFLQGFHVCRSRFNRPDRGLSGGTFLLGAVNFSKAGGADLVGIPMPFKFGFEINWTIVVGMCLMAFVSAVETVGDVSGITKGGAGREATDAEISGATFADGLGTAIAGMFGALPNTSFSQNVGLIAMTGIMSRHVVTIGAIFLVFCGLSPKIAAYVNTIPYPVLGGGVIVMFGMVAAAGVNMLSDVNWKQAQHGDLCGVADLGSGYAASA